MPDSGQDVAAVLAPRGKRRFPVIGELMSGWLISNQGNRQEGHAPRCLFDKLSQGRCSDLKIRTVTSCSGGKYIGRLVVWVGSRGNRHGQAGDYREQEDSHLGQPDHTQGFST